MRTRFTSLKAFLIRYLHSRDGRPCYLSEIYEELAKQRSKKNDEKFRAQVRGILNASIKRQEGIFLRVEGLSGVYGLAECTTDFDKYVDSLEREQAKKDDDKVSREEALQIYHQLTKFAYREANKMHGSSCIVPLEELQSVSHIGLFKGACEFRPSKANNDGKSPIPYLKRCIRGSLLNAIREQKNWNNRNLRVDSGAAMDYLNTNSIEEVADEAHDITNEISVTELRQILQDEMAKHLSSDEIEVVSKRWGLDGNGGATFKKIGKGVCENEGRKHTDDSAKSWAWQVERNARNKLCRNSPVLKQVFQAHYA